MSQLLRHTLSLSKSGRTRSGSGSKDLCDSNSATKTRSLLSSVKPSTTLSIESSSLKKSASAPQNDSQIQTYMWLEDSLVPPPEDMIKKRTRRTRAGKSSQRRVNNGSNTSRHAASLTSSKPDKKKPSTNGGVPPPDYRYLAPLAPRYPIRPREEEGNETLPDYTSSVYHEGFVWKKQELNTPFQGAPNRSWAPIYAVLNNTRLDLYIAIENQFIGCGDKDLSRCVKTKRGSFLCSYTLQYAETGLAVDYNKRPFVVRVRAESEQFLFAFADEQDCVEWARALQMGIDLSLPLEERVITYYRSIPRSRRRRRGHRSGQHRNQSNSSRAASQSSPATSTAVSAGHHSTRIDAKKSASQMLGTSRRSTIRRILESVFGIESRYKTTPRITPAAPQQEVAATTEPASTSVPEEQTSTTRQSRSNSGATLVSINRVDSADSGDESEADEVEYDEEDREYNASQSPNSFDNEQTFGDSSSTLCSSSDEVEKWAPLTKYLDRRSSIRYAQRCLTSLPSDTPWVNKTIVRQGQRYIVKESTLVPVRTAIMTR